RWMDRWIGGAQLPHRLLQTVPLDMTGTNILGQTRLLVLLLVDYSDRFAHRHQVWVSDPWQGIFRQGIFLSLSLSLSRLDPKSESESTELTRSSPEYLMSCIQ